jgi:hypothetical protein
VKPFGLVVPVYNEAARVGEFAAQLVAHVEAAPAGSELVFVDDGSTDDTAALLDSQLPSGTGAIRVLRRPHEGKGAAVAAGLLKVRAPLAGFCDLDLSTPLAELARVRHTAERSPVLAIGSRDLAGSRLTHPEPPWREALGRSYNRLLQATLTPGIVDTQCGAKFAATELWHQIVAECHESGYAWDAEVIAVARALMIPVREIPIEWRHDDRSRVHVLRDGTRMVMATGRIWRNVERIRQVRLQHAVATPAGQPEAEDGGVFAETNAKRLSESDVDHWWFRSKAAFVATALRRTDDGNGRRWLVDGGAGAGGVSVQLGWDPDRLAVVEGNRDLARQAGTLHGLLVAQGHVDHLPFADDSVDVVCLLDVIEHLPDPAVALSEARRVLTRDGRLVINVPAHTWLWSAADDTLGHQRRYTRPSLATELRAAGFRAEILTHVFSWLVAPVWVTRRSNSEGAELGLDKTSTGIELAAIVLTRLERAFIGRVPLPFGTSVLAVARPTR